MSHDYSDKDKVKIVFSFREDNGDLTEYTMIDNFPARLNLNFMKRLWDIEKVVNTSEVNATMRIELIEGKK